VCGDRDRDRLNQSPTVGYARLDRRLGGTVDSCFLCVIGGVILPSSGKRIASEGFGTCSSCGVHACQIHGDKVQGQTYFRCADCLARLGLITAVTTSPPSVSVGGGTPPTDPAIHQILGRGGPILGRRGALFRAIAPGATASTAPLVADADLDAMASCLVAFTDPDLRTVLSRQAVRDWTLAAPDDPRRSLGLPYVDGYTREQQAADVELGATVLRVAADTFQLEAQDWPLRSPDDMPAQAALAAWALATAYTARGAQTLRTSPFLLVGGLRLPPIALLLATAYQNRVSN
jgi:hypothetical protein